MMGGGGRRMGGGFGRGRCDGVVRVVGDGH